LKGKPHAFESWSGYLSFFHPVYPEVPADSV
jgi:hypothetical protein